MERKSSSRFAVSAKLERLRTRVQAFVRTVGRPKLSTQAGANLKPTEVASEACSLDGNADQQNGANLKPPEAVPEVFALDRNADEQEQGLENPAGEAASASRSEAKRPLPPESTSHVTLWDAAYEKLREEKPEVIGKYDELLAKELLASVNTTPDNTGNHHGQPLNPAVHSQPSADKATLDNMTMMGLARMDDKKTAYHIFGHRCIVREQVSQVAGAVGFAKSWIDQAVSASPEASMIWAGVSLVLPLLTNLASADRAHHDAFLYVTRRVEEFAAIEGRLVEIRSDKTRSLGRGLLSLPETHLTELYQHVINFQVQSVLRSFQGWLPRLGRDLIQYDDWRQMRSQIDDAYMLVRGDLGIVNNDRACEAQISLLLVAEQKEQNECLQTFRLTSDTSEGADSSYEWFCNRIAERVEGTCQWFFNQGNYLAWLKDDKGLLLVSADPGCGKSVLSKYLVKEGLPRDVTTLGATVCYFFFVDQNQNTLAQALCAVLHQLFSEQPVLLHHAFHAFSRDGKKLSTNTHALWDIFEKVSRDPLAKPIIVVLDALDECAQADLEALVRKLEDMFISKNEKKPGRVRFLLTSRPYEEIMGHFDRLASAAPCIRIPGEEESDAIATEVDLVIKHRVRELSPERRPWSEGLLNHIEHRLTEMPHRTYLWVHLVLDVLKQKLAKHTKKGIDEVVANLPPTVYEAYEKILDRSADLSQKKRDNIQKIFKIVLAAKEPLTVSQMNVAFNTSPDMESFADLDLEADFHFEANLRSLCGLFISVYHGKIHFFHHTAKEFLLDKNGGGDEEARQPPCSRWRNSCTLPQSNTVLAGICVAQARMMRSIPRAILRPLLIFQLEFDLHIADSRPLDSIFWAGAEPTEDGKLVEADTCLGGSRAESSSASAGSEGRGGEGGEVTKTRRLRNDYHSFLPYALRHWSHHFRAAEGALALATIRSAAGLVGPDGPRLSSVCWPHKSWFTNGMFDYHVSRLGQASTLGLNRLIKHLLDEEKDDVNDCGSAWTPLTWAAYATGPRPPDDSALLTMQVLLSRGAVVKTADPASCEVLLRAAVRLRSVAFIEQILAKGVDVDAMFLHAAWRRDLEVLDMLHQRGANIEARTRRSGYTALLISAAAGLVDQVRWLLERGADPGARDNEGNTALHLACILTSTESHKFLFDASPPHHQLEPREKPCSQGGGGFHPHWEDFRIPRHPGEVATGQVIAVLVQHGANVNDTQNNAKRSPLCMAIWSRDQLTSGRMPEDGEAAVVLGALIRAGADVNLPDSEGNTPIAMAIGYWLDGRSRGGTLVFYFCAWLKPYVEALLNHGAEIDAGRRKFILRHCADGHAGNHSFSDMAMTTTLELDLTKETWARLEELEANGGSEGVEEFVPPLPTRSQVSRGCGGRRYIRHAYAV